MGNDNGEKSKLIYFLLALLQAIFLAWSFRMDGNVSAATIDIAALKANYGTIMQELKEIKYMMRPIRK